MSPASLTKQHLNLILALAISLLSLILLVSLSLNLNWVGGSGRLPACVGHKLNSTSDISVRRGEVMSTTPDDWAIYELCDGTKLWLDHNTQVELTHYQTSNQATSLKLLQGRLIVDGSAIVTTRNLNFVTQNGQCELVHYSWLDIVDATALTSNACQTQPNSELDLTKKFETFTGELLGTSTFNPEASTAKDFYTWTGLKLEALK
jgi:hypothetical protein